MSLKQQTITGAIWSLVQRWGARLWGMVVFFLLARLLEPETFGLVAYAGVFIAVADVFLGQGFVKAIVQRKDLEDEHLNTAFWANVITGVVLTSIVFVVAPFVAHHSGQPSLTHVLRWLSLSFIIGSLANVQDAQLQRSFEYKSLAARTMIGLFAGGIVGVIMAFMGYGVWSLVAQQLVFYGLSTTALWLMSPWRPSLSFSKRHFSDLFGFEANSFGIRALNLINRRSDDLLIGFFLGPTALGFYAIAYRLYYIIAELFSSAVSSVAFSAISRTQEDIPKTRKAFYSLVEMVSFAAFPAFAGLALVSPLLIPLALGPEWTTSVPVLQILCAVGLIQAVLIFNYTVISGCGKPQWEFRLNIVSAIVNLTSFLLVVEYGIAAVAAAYTVRAYLMAPVSLYLVKRLIGIRYTDYLKLFVPAFISTSVMAAAIYAAFWLTPDFSVLSRLVISVGVGGLTYLASLRLVAPKAVQKITDLVGSALPKRRAKANS